MQPSPEQSKILEKIRKLLRLSRSDNEHEAAAAAAKAQQLLSEHNLTVGNITPEQAAREFTASHAHRKTRQRLELWAHKLAAAAASAFDCKYYHNLATGETSFVGCGPDPDVCGWTYGYLYKALLALASAYMRGPAKRLRATRSKAMARNSYLAGAVYMIGMRLEAQKKDTPITPGALVPVKEAVISRSMPELTPRQVPPQKIRDNDFVNGMDAGNSVPLSKPISASSPRRQRLHG